LALDLSHAASLPNQAATPKPRAKPASGSERVIQSVSPNVYFKHERVTEMVVPLREGGMFEDNSILPEVVSVMALSAVAFFLIIIFFGW
jgi:hypothetical protein